MDMLVPPPGASNRVTVLKLLKYGCALSSAPEEPQRPVGHCTGCAIPPAQYEPGGQGVPVAVAPRPHGDTK